MTLRPRPVTYLVNFGLSTRTAGALIRSGWHTLDDLAAAIDRHGDLTDTPGLHTYLGYDKSGIGPTGAQRAREAIINLHDGQHRYPDTGPKDRVTNHYIHHIADGHLPHGDPIPTADELADTHGIAVEAARYIGERLRTRGYAAQDGNGTWIAINPELPPYTLTYHPTVHPHTQAIHGDAVDLLRHNPYLITSDLKVLKPITGIDWDHHTRTVHITTIDSRQAAPHEWYITVTGPGQDETPDWTVTTRGPGEPDTTTHYHKDVVLNLGGGNRYSISVVSDRHTPVDEYHDIKTPTGE